MMKNIKIFYDTRRFKLMLSFDNESLKVRVHNVKKWRTRFQIFIDSLKIQGFA